MSPDFRIHGSTQMTVSSSTGVEFAQEVGCHLVVLARETSIKEINKIQQQLGDRQVSRPLEVSESAGGRSIF
ncbi:U32 family peptidase [[Leptolyngbya] sp. PCC 7376]|uniref:U32 family peptidase n=1 Tax=[Leptolyngbya] sp. PCC 7376 TaxID=111781 RepID=UPI0021F8C044|nr:U32 family peptidase [[Leptolyngbya] sp. PCC 7376]